MNIATLTKTFGVAFLVCSSTAIAIGAEPVELDARNPRNWNALHTWLSLPGLYYREWADKSGSDYPVDIQIQAEGEVTKVYGPQLGGASGAEVHPRVHNGRLVIFFQVDGKRLKGNVVDSSTVQIENVGTIRRWVVPTAWYGKDNAVISIRSGSFAYLDVVESNGRRWKLRPSVGSANFTVTGEGAQGSGILYTRSINFSGPEGDQWTPYFKDTAGKLFRGPLGGPLRGR